MNDQSKTSGGVSFTPRMVLDAALHHPFVVIASLVVCGTSGFLAGKGAVPLYTASTTILIEREAEQLVTLDDLFQNAGDATFSQTQVELMTGSATARRVIENENLLEDPEFDRFRSGTSTWSNVREWVLAIPGAARDLIGGNGDAPVPVPASTPSPVAPVTEVERDEIQRAAEEEYLNSLGVFPVRNTDLVDIYWSHPDPQLAARIANATASAYIEMTDEARDQRFAQMNEYLESEIDRLQGEISAAEIEQARLMPGGDETNELAKALDDLAADHAGARAERIRRQIRHEQLIGSDPAEHPEVRANGAVLRLRSDLEAAEQDYADLSRTFTEEYPPVQDAKARVDSLIGRLEREEVRAFQALADLSRVEHEMAIDRESRLEGLLDDRRAEMAERSGNLVQYEGLQARIRNARERLDTLVARQAQSSMSSRLQGAGSFYVRVVEPARAPSVPNNPTRSYFLFSLVAGLLLGVGLAVGLDHIDSSFVTPDDAQRYLGLPGLGLVPNAQGPPRGLSRLSGRYRYERYEGYGYPYLAEYTQEPGSPANLRVLPAGAEPALGVIEHPRSAFAESYRALRTRLLLSEDGQMPHAVAVTSATPGEGKTTAAINLAAAFAAAGKKTLLVDADLRRPGVHRFFDQAPNVGLVEVLSGGLPLKSAVQTTKVKGLWLLAAGDSQEQANELLSSPRFNSLILEARRKFDFVVIDTSPLLAVVDALMVVAGVDGTLVVVQRGATSSATVDRVCNLIEESSGRVLGVLLNEPTSRRSRRRAKQSFSA